MRRKALSVLGLSICCALFLVSCSSIDKEGKNKEDEQIKEVYVPPTPDLDKCKDYVEAGKLMIESVIKGIYDDNYQMYSRDFTEKNKRYFNHEVFNEAAIAVRDELGEIKGKEYIGFWVKGNYHILLWKAQFTKTEDDILIEMYVIKNDDSVYQIAAVKLI